MERSEGLVCRRAGIEDERDAKIRDQRIDSQLLEEENFRKKQSEQRESSIDNQVQRAAR